MKKYEDTSAHELPIWMNVVLAIVSGVLLDILLDSPPSSPLSLYRHYVGLSVARLATVVLLGISAIINTAAIIVKLREDW